MSQPHATLYPAQMLDGIERTRVLNEYRIELAPLIDEAREEFPSGLVDPSIVAGATRPPMLCLPSLRAAGAPP